ncbi:hypothetical protein HBB16_20880 [Pseudonocardia sp. MCCB 268]|nr:hypothetical protein [Pseudonocardia cytotoxica]
MAPSDPQIRACGSGGTLAHADPAADLPAAVLALTAARSSCRTAGRRSSRSASSTSGVFTTVREPGRADRRDPTPRCGDQAGRTRSSPAPNDWAIVAVAVSGDQAGQEHGLDVVAATATEQALKGRQVDRRGGRAGRRGTGAARRHARHPRLPHPPGAGPHPPGPGDGTRAALILGRRRPHGSPPFPRADLVGKGRHGAMSAPL